MNDPKESKKVCIEEAQVSYYEDIDSGWKDFSRAV